MDHTTNQAQSSKRPKLCPIDSDKLICPITHQLPVYPVMAEDGRIYERSAIEQHLSITKFSPVTHEPMGARLIPSLKTEDAIQALIWTGPITDELKNSWIQRNQQKRKIILLKQAQDGDARAMLEASRKYHYGEDGFKVDHEKSFKWLEKGYRAGDVRAASLLGWHAVDGKYAPFDDQIQNSIKGAMLLGIAANGGSTFAAVKLGYAYADGLHGFPVDKPEAIYWLQKALKNEPFGSIWFRKKAIAKLNELIAASSES